MKKKIVFGLAAFFFAAITTLSFATNSPANKEDFNPNIGGNCGGALAAHEWKKTSLWGGNREFNRCSPGCPIQEGRDPKYTNCY